MWYKINKAVTIFQIINVDLQILFMYPILYFINSFVSLLMYLHIYLYICKYLYICLFIDIYIFICILNYITNTNFFTGGKQTSDRQKRRYWTVLQVQEGMTAGYDLMVSTTQVRFSLFFKLNTTRYIHQSWNQCLPYTLFFIQCVTSNIKILNVFEAIFYQ